MEPSLDRIRRVVAAAGADTVARMGVLARIPGNPVGIAVRRDDNVIALMARRRLAGARARRHRVHAVVMSRGVNGLAAGHR